MIEQKNLFIRNFIQLRSNNLFIGIIAYLIIILFSIPCIGQTSLDPLLGDYLSPNLDSHTQQDLIIQRLKDLGANTYMWEIGGYPDWEDLSSFLPKAKIAGIKVWAYLRPPTETPQAGGCCYSEPYEGDYIAWAQAIANLSLRYSNLVGYAIDDFWYNTAYDSTSSAGQRFSGFTPSYINSMVSTAKSINPRLKFYPLMYFYQIRQDFINNYAPLVDGVIAAYPGSLDNRYIGDDSACITEISSLLNSDYQPFIIKAPTSSLSGNYGLDTVNIVVTNASNISLSLYHFSSRYLDVFAGGSDYVKLKLIVDNDTAWSIDSQIDSNGIANIDLTNLLQGKSAAKLKIGLLTNKNTYSFSTTCIFAIISKSGFNYTGNHGVETKGFYPITFSTKSLPIIVMPYGIDGGIYTSLYSDSPTPENIAKHIQITTNFLLRKQIEGVVPFALDLSSTSTVFPLAQQIYQSFWSQYK